MYQIIYSSEAIVLFDVMDLAKLLTIARSRHHANGVTDMLVLAPPIAFYKRWKEAHLTCWPRSPGSSVTRATPT